MMERLFDESLPVLPYRGSSGWSGSEASRERAERQDKNGTTAARQQQVLDMLRDAGQRGLTWSEAGFILDLHHGAISSVLSVLHRDGSIARLEERRNRCSVYVCHEFVAGRRTSDHKPNMSSRVFRDILEALAADLDDGNVGGARERIYRTLGELK